jgi:DNA adenine methylase
MRYSAGKSRIAAPIAKAILSHTRRRLEYFEPFVGGGSVLAAMSKHFIKSEAGDIHKDLILMWQAVMDGWEPPHNVTEAEFRYWEKQPNSAMRGFVGFSSSFGGKWFGAYARFVKPGGIQQNFADESARKIERYRSSFRNVTFTRRTYTQTPYTKKSVIYCDPPYEGTYSYSEFDSPTFWSWAETAVKAGAHVYVSEFKAPPNWVPIWSIKRSIMFGSNAGFRKEQDTLYVHESQREHPLARVGEG